MPETQEVNSDSQRQREVRQLEVQHGKQLAGEASIAQAKTHRRAREVARPVSSLSRPFRKTDGVVTLSGLSETTEHHTSVQRRYSDDGIEEDDSNEVIKDPTDDIVIEYGDDFAIVKGTPLGPGSFRRPTGSITRTISVVSETSINNSEDDKPRTGKRKQSLAASNISNVGDEDGAHKRQGKRPYSAADISDYMNKSVGDWV